ncbi:hypothetical protein Cadr_000000032 [Camelus dromedarius]|uniref:Uncharacterized protein n=1 Tax=Camelus dromedarius TaxID=9838 RepID=A0A5N4EMI7_CAMDR|nr:hypothetical protein Cadr_000000032 [Camelus dromedarius]
MLGTLEFLGGPDRKDLEDYRPRVCQFRPKTEMMCPILTTSKDSHEHQIKYLGVLDRERQPKAGRACGIGGGGASRPHEQAPRECLLEEQLAAKAGGKATRHSSGGTARTGRESTPMGDNHQLTLVPQLRAEAWGGGHGVPGRNVEEGLVTESGYGDVMGAAREQTIASLEPLQGQSGRSLVLPWVERQRSCERESRHMISRQPMKRGSHKGEDQGKRLRGG